MNLENEVRQLLEALATHPVLPPVECLPANDENLHALLADLARGERSSHAELLQSVAAECATAPEEVARRAEFLLACVVLPRSGTHYEVLGVTSQATTEEIRKRWASLIQRYHPDHLGGRSGWLDGQARRLIEAYRVLKDPERRRQYDAELPREGQGAWASGEVSRVASAHSRVGPARWQWVPIGILSVGLAMGFWAYTRALPTPLPAGSLPAAPKLLDTLDRGELRKDESAPSQLEEPSSTPAMPPERGPRKPSVSVELPSVRNHAPAAPDRDLPAPSRPEQGEAIPSVAPGTAAPLDFPRQATVSIASPLPTPSETAAAPGHISASPPGLAIRPPVEQANAVELPHPRREELLAPVEAFRIAYERKDLRAVMGLFGSEPGERNVTGRRAIEQLYARNFAVLENIHYDLSELDVSRLSAQEEFLVEGRFRIQATYVGSPRAVDMSGPIRWLVRKEGGFFRIVRTDYEVTSR